MVGCDDAQPVGIVLHVALKTFTNHVNEVFATEVEFPIEAARRCTFFPRERRPLHRQEKRQ